MSIAGYSPLIWIGFHLLILGLLALDLGVLQGRRQITFREALLKTAGYIVLALMFAGLLFLYAGPHTGLEFVTGYFLEYALSMDNIMVFVLILAHFRVPAEYQSRVLIWGIIGALVLRGLFIFAGLALLSMFEWIMLVFGALLITTGVKSLSAGGEDSGIESGFVVRRIYRLLPIAANYDGDKFFTRSEGAKLKGTPLLAVLVVLSVIDIVFAVDSIPAIFAITRDPFVVYTSNVFAVLGLRALYFALANLIDKFRYLKTGLSLVLIFIGAKMIFNYPESLPDIPTEWSLIITAVLVFGSIILSLWKNHTETANKERSG